MSEQESKHLLDDAILWALINPDKLQRNEKIHLQSCQICQDKQASFLHELNEIKHLSKAFLPKTKRNLRPVTIARKSLSPLYFRMKNAFVYAFMIMICIAGIFGLWPIKNQTIDQVAIKEAKTSIENMLGTTEVNYQNGIDSILPVTFQYIVADEFEIMSNPFYDYVFPISTFPVDDS
jgi:hypothetical protein